MDKALEDYLWEEIGKDGPYRPLPRDVIDDMLTIKMINNAKQAHRTLEKWERKGKYEYGSCLDLGWKIRGAHES